MKSLRRVRRIGQWLALLALWFGLAGCQLIVKIPAEPAPTATDMLDPLPTATAHLPREDQQLTATDIPQTEAAATPTLAPTRTPKVSATPTRTRKPTVVPTATTVPTVDPKRLATAARAFADGDMTLAISLYEEKWVIAPATQKPAIGIPLARAYMEESRYQDAIPLLTEVLSQTTTVTDTAEAVGLRATAYEAVADWTDAITDFRSYLEIQPAPALQVGWHMARAYEARHDEAAAAQQLAAIDIASQAPAQQAEVLEELANVRRRLQDYDGALEAYDRIMAIAVRPDYRALILQRQGETLRDAGRRDEAIETFVQVLQEYRSSPVALSALQALDGWQAAQVSDLERGEILLRGGQYEACLEVLQRYLSAHPNEQTSLVHYDLGQAYESLGRHTDAFREYDVLIERFPVDPLTPLAWMAKADMAKADMAKVDAERANVSDPTGIYLEFVRRNPSSPRASEALWLAADWAERKQVLAEPGAQDWAQPEALYRRMRTEYSSDGRAAEAAFREGLMAYARRETDAALKVWTEALPAVASAEERARRLTWIGLALAAKGDVEGARRQWEEARTHAPWSYYGLRARDLIAGAPLRLPESPLMTVSSSQPNQGDWTAIETWVQGLPRVEGGLGSTITADALAARGAALWRLGWEKDSMATYRLLRDKVWDRDAAGLLALLRVFEGLGINQLTISTAERLLVLGSQAGAPAAPGALLKLSYPTLYGHLVSAEGQQRNVDPLLFLALVRQESRFDPHALSYAGAAGLTQVMPSTGKGIAAQLGEPNYRDELLFRPVVGVRYGVYYLADALNRNDRDWVAALVAYNAGPGNLRRWTHGQPIGDHDLFYETVPIEQTQDYIRLIYQQYRMYQAIYQPG
jgi:soluble lytic murein transglycosylase